MARNGIRQRRQQAGGPNQKSPARAGRGTQGRRGGVRPGPRGTRNQRGCREDRKLIAGSAIIRSGWRRRFRSPLAGAFFLVTPSGSAPSGSRLVVCFPDFGFPARITLVGAGFRHDLARHHTFADNVRRHLMARKRPSAGRLQNPRDELQRAIQRTARGLAGASGEGFREVLMRVRQAVVDSERLVVVLDRLARQGLRPRGSSPPLPPSDVQEPIRAVRATVGRLANTTPSKFSSDFDQYTQSVGALIAVGQCVLDRGVEPSVKLEELDEWTPFRER